MAPENIITVPSKLLDANLRHQVNLGRYQTGVVHDIIGMLNDADKELVAAIQKRAGVNNFTTARLEALLETTRQIIQETSDTLLKKTGDTLSDFAQHEAAWGVDVLKKMVLGQIDIVTPAAERLAAIATDKPFQGALLSEWFGKVASDKQHAVTQALRMGQVQGETIDQMVRRLTGSAKDYEAGIFGKVRTDTEAVVRTAVNHTSNNAQQMLLKQNEDIMQGWTFCATLDGRTTLICASLSGTKWPLGQGPIPPRHFRCRSFALPLLKTWKELGINLEEFPESERASVGGPVRADITFSEWLKTQPESVQNEILGKTRGQLFREGGLTVDKFADATGNVYNLNQLKQREAEAFQEVFPNGVTHSGGGHLGKTIPVSGPQDFSHVLAPQYVDPLAAANKAAVSRGAQGAEEDLSPLLGEGWDTALEKKWKAYKPQIKGKLLKGIDLSGAEQKILADIPGEELTAFKKVVDDAKLAKGLPVDIPKPVAPVQIVTTWTDTNNLTSIAEQFATLGIKNTTYVATNDFAAAHRLNLIGKDLARLTQEFQPVKELLLKNPLNDLIVDGTSDGIAMKLGGKAAGIYNNINKSLTVALSTKGTQQLEFTLFTPGNFSAQPDLFGTFRHELGHHLHYSMDKKLWNEWMTLFDKKGTLLKEELSKYAATNAKEFFAEAFSVYTSPLYKNGMLTQEVEALLEKIVGKRLVVTAEEVLAETIAKAAVEKAAAEAMIKKAEEAAAKAAFEKKWKAYKPQIKSKLIKDLPLTQAESKILGEIETTEHDALLKAVEEAKAKLIPKITPQELDQVTQHIVKSAQGVKLTAEEEALINKVAKHAPDDFQKAAVKAAEEHAAFLKAAEEAAAKKAAEEAAAKEATQKAAAEKAANDAKLAAFDDAMQKKWKAYKPQIKGKLVNGKELTGAEKKILSEVPKHEYDDLMTKVDDALGKKGVVGKVDAPVKGTETATTKPVIPTQPAHLNINDFDKIGGQLGSNAGGTYVNRATGENFYIKMPATNDIAQNEIMAAQLYKLAGVDIADMQLIDLGNGKWGVASKWVNGLASDGAALQAGKLAGVYEGFGVDAWLANWDVVGLGYDNMKVLNGIKAVRVDPGGALFYRAQGGLKTLTNDVTELKTLLDAKINPQSASVFKGMSTAERDDALRRVLRLKPDDIRATVDRVGTLWTQAKRDELVKVLLARQEDIAKQFPELVEKPVIPVGRTTVTKDDFWKIRNARGNGSAIRIDYNQIEDQQILFHVEKLSNGADGIVGTFKIREAGDKQLADFIKNAAGKTMDPTFEPLIKGFTADLNNSTYQYILDTVKGVAAQANNSGLIRDKDIQRAKTALKAIETVHSTTGALTDVAWNKYIEPWVTWLDNVAKATAEVSPAGSYKLPGTLNKFEVPLKKIMPPEIKTDAEIQFFRRKGTYTASKMERGNIIRTNVEESLNVGGENYFYEANLDGVRIKYWPRNDAGVAYALQGRMQVSTLEASEAAINKAIELLDRIGLNVEMPSIAQSEELYLQKIAYHVNDKSYFDMLQKVQALGTPEERAAAWKPYVSKVLNVPDVTKLPDYNPTGKSELWDQGNKLFHRPDLQGAEWDTFTKDYRLQHTFWGGDYVGSFDRILETGGKLISSADRVRRGVPWGTSSASSDFNSGGADYVFTRVKAVGESQNNVGLYWKPNNHLRRLDAISYRGDAYGHVKASYPTGWGTTPDAKLGENGFVITNRSASDPKSWAKVASSGSNETIFKGGLSIFDDIDRINIPSNQYEGVLNVFRKHGINTWPDGRKLTDVIIKM